MPRIGGNPRDKFAAPPPGPFTSPQNPAPIEGEEIPVDMMEGAPQLPSTFEMQGDEMAEVDGPMSADNDADAGDFSDDANLAEALPDDYLATLGRDIVQMVERDITERKPWRDRFERGLEMMGLIDSDIDDGAFPGGSNVIHPLLAEAVTQFWARSMAELFPADGPAKSKLFGKQDKAQLDRGTRVAEYLNYEMTVEDEGYIPESSRMMWNVPLAGSAFRKTYRDPVLGRSIGIFVSVDDLIVPAEATTLKTATRFTHRMRRTPNEIVAMTLAEYYREVDLDLPTDAGAGDDDLKDIQNEAHDITPDGDNEDALYEILETCIDLKIPGDEHFDADGEETDLKRSYYVTTERTSKKVLSIYRGWKQKDPKCRRRVPFTKYGFVPGFGFYDFGFLHLLGGLQAAATGALRVLLDGAATASLSGGFVSKNANLKGETMIVSPGEWKPVDVTSEDLGNAFFPIPVREPSPALFNLLGLLVDGGKSFSNTTEAATGQGDGKNVAVGTINKLVEQGEKVMSTIHRMAHRSLQDELNVRYELARDHAPDDGYPYDVAGEERSVYASDFGKDIAIAPVSDPNIFSSGQRLAISQMVYETAMANPDKVNGKKAIKRLFEAARVPDIDDLIKEDAEAQAYDPNGEVQAILLGKPVMVNPDQPHVEHLKLLWAFASNPEFGANPQVQQQIGGALASVIAQHLAYGWTTHSRALGASAGYMDPETGQVQQPEVPPEQLAQMLAQIAPQLTQVPGLPAVQGPEGAGDQGAAEAKQAEAQAKIQGKTAELQMKREEHDQKMQLRMEEMQFKMQELAAKLDAKLQELQQKAQIANQKAVVDIQSQQRQAEVDQANSERQMIMDAESAERDRVAMDRESQIKEAGAMQDMQIKASNSKLDALRGPANQGGF